MFRLCICGFRFGSGGYSVLPATVYVEDLGGDIVPVERAFFHLILHNTSTEPIEFQWVRFDLAASAGSVVSGQFSGPGLIELFDKSVERRRIEVTPGGTPGFGSGRTEGALGYFFRVAFGIDGSDADRGN